MHCSHSIIRFAEMGVHSYATMDRGVQPRSHVAPLDLDSDHQGRGYGNVKGKIHTPFLNHMTSRGLYDTALICSKTETS